MGGDLSLVDELNSMQLVWVEFYLEYVYFSTCHNFVFEVYLISY